MDAPITERNKSTFVPKTSAIVKVTRGGKTLYEKKGSQPKKVYDVAPGPGAVKVIEQIKQIEARTPEVKTKVAADPAHYKSYLTQEQINLSGHASADTLRHLEEVGAPVSVQLDYISHFGTSFQSGTRQHVQKLNQQVKTLQELRGEEQFNKAVELGYIPKGSIYVPFSGPATPEAAKTSPNWRLYTPEQLRAKKELTKQAAMNIAKQVATDWQVREHIANALLGKLPVESLSLAERQKLVSAQEMIAGVPFTQTGKLWTVEPSIEQEQYQRALAELKKYRISSYTPEVPEGYDIIAFLRDNPNKTHTLINAGFSRDTINAAVDTLKLDPFVKGEGFDLLSILRAEVKPSELIRIGFGKAVVNQGIDALKKYDLVDANKNTLTIDQLVSQIEQTQKELGERGIGKEGGIKTPWEVFRLWTALGAAGESRLLTWDELSDTDKKKVAAYYTTTAKTPAEGAKTMLPESKEFAILSIPFYGSYHYYQGAKVDGLSTWEKGQLAGMIAADVVCIILPMVMGARAGAVAARGLTTGAKIKGALRGIKAVAIAEVKSPITTILHPKATAKAVTRSFATALHPKKIPTAAAEATFTTTRIPVTDFPSPQAAITTRDALVSKMARGESAIVKVGDTTFELKPVALQKVGEPVLISATPDVRPFLNGATLDSDLFLSPTLHTRFAEATSIGTVPEGGIKGALIINDPTILKKATSSGKLYYGAVRTGEAELEAVIRAGIKLSPPSQILETYSDTGETLRLLVIGKPYSAKQVAQLKVLGAVDTIKQIYSTPVSISKVGQNYDDLLKLQSKANTLSDTISELNKANQTTLAAQKAEELVAVQHQAEALTRRVTESLRQPASYAFVNYTPRGILETYNLATGARTPVRANTRYAVDMRVPAYPAISTAEEARRSVLPEQLKVLRRAELPRRIVEPARQSGIPRRGGIPRRTEVTSRPEPTRRVQVTERLEIPRPPYIPTTSPPITPRPPRIPRQPYIPELPRIPGWPKQPPTKREQALVKNVVNSPKKPGIVSWRQGVVWVSVFPPYQAYQRHGKTMYRALPFVKGERVDVVYTPQPPPLAKRTKGTPFETVYTWKGPPPEELTLDMGVVDVKVVKGHKISFKRVPVQVITKTPTRPAPTPRRIKYPEPEKLLYADTV